ncbi:unnamed protein product [Withania somnifera]
MDIPFTFGLLSCVSQLPSYLENKMSHYRRMAGKEVIKQPTSAFDFEIVEGVSEHLTTVMTSSCESSPWIDSASIKLRHRIGRGVFGDVWLATCHQTTADYDEYHEVAVKMLHPMKADNINVVLDRLGSLFTQCQGLQHVCWTQGLSVINGKLCIVMKFYESSIGDKMARVKGGKMSLQDVISSLEAAYGDGGWRELGSRLKMDKSSGSVYSKWLVLKDQLQIRDTVRSRKSPNSYKPENMEVPEGTIVGMERDMERNGFVLVRVHGIHDPLRVHGSTLERVTFGLAAGEWVRLKEDRKKHSSVGILHSIDRDGKITVAFIGLETLWKGNFSELQMAEAYSAGQFVKLKPDTFSPRFEWPRKRGGDWATGRICQVLPNGCLVVNFPGMLVFGDENSSFLADPAEVETVSFDSSAGIVKKYQHLEDFHWAVRPLLIALGLFTAMKLGIFVGKKVGRSKLKNGCNPVMPNEGQQGEVQTGNAAWLPQKVANIIFREGASVTTAPWNP